jgi:cytochrome c oxidase assembly protein Cox11
VSLPRAQEQRLLPGEKIDMPVLFYLARAPTHQ